jgi:hypothetical protein
MLVMAAGVGLFGVLTGFLANAFLAPPKSPDDDESATQLASSESAALQTQLAELRVLNETMLERLDVIERSLRADSTGPRSAAG